MEKFGIGGDFGKVVIEFEGAFDVTLFARLKLCLEETGDGACAFVEVDRLKLRLRHLRKLAEARDDGFEIRDFGEQSGGTFLENLIELFRALLASTQKIFDSELQGEERIFQLVGEAAGEFAPGGDTLGLNELLLLLDEFARHAVEGGGKISNFVG